VIFGFPAAMRRADAPIDGLLSGGRNRKKPVANLLRSDTLGLCLTLPENRR
jgi:hypothetical protein